VKQVSKARCKQRARSARHVSHLSIDLKARASSESARAPVFSLENICLLGNITLCSLFRQVNIGPETDGGGRVSEVRFDILLHWKNAGDVGDEISLNDKYTL
jgi:hypothetical protein